MLSTQIILNSIASVVSVVYSYSIGAVPISIPFHSYGLGNGELSSIKTAPTLRGLINKIMEISHLESRQAIQELNYERDWAKFKESHFNGVVWVLVIVVLAWLAASNGWSI